MNRILRYLDNLLTINNTYIVISLFIYKFVLDFVYVNFVYPVYGSDGMTYDYRLYKYIFSLLLFITLLKPIVRLYKSEDNSSKICLVLNWLYFIPGCTYYSFADVSDGYFVYFAFSWILYLFFQIKFPQFRIPAIKQKYSIYLFYTISLAFLLINLFTNIYYNGFKFQWSLIDVYDNRFAAREIHLPVFLEYISGMSMMFFAIMTAYSLVFKRKLLFAILLIAGFLNFSFGAHKSHAFSIILSILICFYYQGNRFKWIPNILSSVGVLSFFSFFSIISALLFYRSIFIPEKLSFYYYDFTSSNTLLYLRDSIFSRFASSPYDLPINFKISEIYAGDASINANQGLIGDSFSNFGWYSLIAYPFLWVLMGKLFDSFSYGIDNRITVLAALIIVLLLISGTYFSIYLTGGVFLGFFLLYTMPRKN